MSALKAWGWYELSPHACPFHAQELFETPYFCQDQKQELFELARPFEGNHVLQRFADLAKELQVGSCAARNYLLGLCLLCTIVKWATFCPEL